MAKRDTSGQDDVLKEAQDAFELCVEHEAENRRDALDDIRFGRLSEQWPEAVRRQRELDGRPCQTINVLPTYIRQVVNDGRQNRPAITIHPASDGADEEVAQIYNGLIRNIEVTSDADVAYDTALDNSVTHGLGYWRVNTCYADDDSFLQDLRIDAIPNPFSVYGDPFSVAADSADWNVAFIVDTMRRKAFERKYKDAEPVDWDVYGAGEQATPWFEDDQVMVAEYWTREEALREIVALSTGEIIGVEELEANLALFQAQGVQIIGSPRAVRSHKVTQRLMTGAEVLETVHWAGKYIPIVPVYGEVVNLEGRRFLRGLIRDAKDSQQNINFMRTAAVETVGYAPKVPWIGPRGAFATDADKWETANTESHAYLEYDGAVPPERQPFPGPPAGYIQAVSDAVSDLKSVIGLQDASMGIPSNETSGRAILARMREGDVSTFHYIDNLSRAIRHTGRILIDLIPKVYSTPRMVRVMGQDGQPSQVPINQPVVPAPQQQGAPGLAGQQQRYVPAPAGGPQAPPSAPPASAPMPGAPPVSQPGQPQQLQAQALAKTFDLTVGKYDLTVEAGPSFTTRREEAAQQMITLAQADPTILPVIGDLLVKNLDWPGAQEIADRLAQMRQQQQQPKPGDDPNAKAQADAQATMAKINAEAQAKQQQMEQDHALAVQQAQQEAALAKYKADAQIALQRETNAQTIQLKREQAAAELQLARESAAQATQIKMIEAARGADQTVDQSPISIGGGVG
jgi:hypothetical protein